MSISSELSNSLLILIEGNQNGYAVVAYWSAFTWLAIMSSSPQLTFLLLQDFYN